MNAEELQALLHSTHPPTLLHVLPPEIFAAAHLPASVNACIYETAFPDHIRALALDPAAPLVVYGAGEGSLDAATAAEKLRALGFTRVETFEGGLAEWQSAGLPLEGTGQFPQPPVCTGTYAVDTQESVIRWTGRNLFNHHSGTVRLAGGEIVLRDGRLTSARFTIAMTTIACEDLADSALNAMLLAHLCTTDFFDTAHHPTAEFAATAAEPIHPCTDGTPNYLLRGTFTLRGITHPLEFPVLIAARDDGQHLTGQGVLTLDRTAYGSHYGSGKLFRYLGQHVVNDHIHLHVKIYAGHSAVTK
ncbi:MAG: YceI family protein [Chthoniobacter sp.]|nr:YceI family protein [Chthoniobacter sp.]